MDKIWFISINDVVKGPLTTEDAERQLSKAANNARSLVWWKGQNYWVPHSEWKSQRDNVLRDRTEAGSIEQTFFLDAGRETEGPFSIQQIGTRLSELKELDMVRLWSPEKKKWLSLFDLPHICDRLGITRRSHPRVPLVGIAQIQKEQLDLTAPVISVSIGGFGVKFDQPVNLAGVVAVTLKSASLFNVIKTRAEVAYNKPDGSVGFKFLSLNVENQSAIVEYIRNFESDQNSKAA